MSLFKGNKKIAGLYVDHEIEHATETHAGIIEIADNTEVEQGVIDSKSVTPKKLKTELDKKQNIIEDLTTIRSNASTGAGLAPQVAINTQRIEDLTTARIPDVIYHGTPKITGGQVSNFSTVNYLQFPFEDISRSLPFNIYFSFTTDDDVTTQQNIIDSHFGIALAIQNSKGVMALSSNGTSWDIGTSTGTNTILPNTTYYVKYSWTGTEYNASLSTNDQSYVPDMILQSNKSLYKTTIYIGGSEGLFGPNTAHPFKGIINFTKSRVDVNGITVWEGMADVGIASRANVSLSNLDEQGQTKFDAKQDKLTAGTNITIENNVISASGGLAEVSWGGITGDIENQTDLQSEFQNVREVAEGKTKSYVVSYADNPLFNSQDAEIKLQTTFIDINGITHDIEELKLGDNLFVQETDVPDRWCSQPSKGESILPEEYTQLEFIKSTGTQYIDTGIIFDTLDTKVEIGIDVTSTNKDAFGFSNPTRDSNWYSLYTNNFQAYFGTTGSNVLGNLGNGISGVKRDIVLTTDANKRLQVKVNNLLKIDKNFTGDYIVNGQKSFAILTANGSLTTSRCTSSQLWYTRLYKNDTLVFNGIPAKRNSDETIGMYDLVSNTFFTNSGTGKFIAGPALEKSVTFYKLETSKVDLTNYATNTALTQGLATKQNTLISGTNIKTINNESILGTGNFDVSSIEPLSQEEYNRRKEAGELDENKFYSTPNDVSLEILSTLYPVGSLYLTTTSTCPLASLGIGTWQLEATDRVLQGAGSRGAVGTNIAESLPNITGHANAYAYKSASQYATGVFTMNDASANAISSGSSSGYNYMNIDFDASHSSSTYQDNAPVQQDAYLINIFRRIA